ncbi:MAG: EamA family transporter [Candidatus Limnocylindrales bacterium]
MDRRRALGLGLVVVAGASFASGSIFATLSYTEGLDWLTVMWWRFLIGATLAWGWLLASARRRSVLRAMPRRQVAVALGLGALYSGNAGTYYAGIETIPAALAGVLVYVYPVFVALLSLRFATRLPGRRPWIALGLAVTGVVLALGGLDLSRPLPIAGLLSILASAAIYSVWIVLSARLSGERRDRLGSEAPESSSTARDAGVTTALMMAATAVVFGFLSLATGRSLAPGAVPAGAWPFLVGIGLVATFLAIQTLYAGARRIGAAQAALVSTTEPLFIVALSAVVLDQHLGPLQLVGAALILVGVVIAQTSPRPRGAPEPATPMEAEVEG